MHRENPEEHTFLIGSCSAPLRIHCKRCEDEEQPSRLVCCNSQSKISSALNCIDMFWDERVFHLINDCIAFKWQKCKSDGNELTWRYSSVDIEELLFELEKSVSNHQDKPGIFLSLPKKSSIHLQRITENWFHSSLGFGHLTALFCWSGMSLTIRHLLMAMANERQKMRADEGKFTWSIEIEW